MAHCQRERERQASIGFRCAISWQMSRECCSIACPRGPRHTSLLFGPWTFWTTSITCINALWLVSWCYDATIEKLWRSWTHSDFLKPCIAVSVTGNQFVFECHKPSGDRVVGGTCASKIPLHFSRSKQRRNTCGLLHEVVERYPDRKSDVAISLLSSFVSDSNSP